MFWWRLSELTIRWFAMAPPKGSGWKDKDGPRNFYQSERSSRTRPQTSSQDVAALKVFEVKLESSCLFFTATLITDKYVQVQNLVKNSPRVYPVRYRWRRSEFASLALAPRSFHQGLFLHGVDGLFFIIRLDLLLLLLAIVQLNWSIAIPLQE